MTDSPPTVGLLRLLASLGLSPLDCPTPAMPPILPVILDGRIVGEMGEEKVRDLANKLRILKATGNDKVMTPQCKICNSGIALPHRVVLFLFSCHFVRMTIFLPGFKGW